VLRHHFIISRNLSRDLLYTCSQPKGADRKHKTDREKLDKKSEADRVPNI